MLKLPISLDAIPNNSAIGMKAKLCQWHSLTHNSDTSVVASGSPSNPIAFFGRKDRRRERAKTVSGRLQLLEEINTWQKQKKRERECLPIGLGREEDAGLLAIGVFGGGDGQREQKRKDRVRAGNGRHRKRRYVDEKSESRESERGRDD